APPLVFWRAVVALVEGDTVRLRTLLDGAPDTAEQAGGMLEEFQALRGLYAVAMGDTAGGLRTTRDALRRAGYGPQAVGNVGTLGLLATLIEATRPELRERAVEHLDLIIAS